MAFAVGSRVRVKLTSAAFTGALGLLQPQPPLFGRITKLTATTADLLIEQGDALQTDTSFLDEITGATAPEVVALLDKIVVGLNSNGGQFGSAYVGRVVAMFDSDDEARVLIRTLVSDMYYEMPVTLIAVLKDR